MKLFSNGKPVSLTKRDFVTSGGEGSIYIKGRKAYKLYTDPNKAIPLGKIKELSTLSGLPNIINPETPLQDQRGHLVGYSMDAVDKSYALCQLFPRAFRDREGVTPSQVLSLVQKLQKGVDDIHARKILIVDLNEMNFLIKENFSDVYFIDVDSYQTPTYKATALMESVRDRKVKNNQFTVGSDWFSFAIVSFQMFIGIHPYKGKHPKVKGMSDRMDANITVFDKEVSIPKVCYPLNTIPQAYLDWYRAVLLDGKRVSPPNSAKISLVLNTKVISGADLLKIKEILSADSRIRKVWSHLGNIVAETQDSVWYENRKYKKPYTQRMEIGWSVTSQAPIQVFLHDSTSLKIKGLFKKEEVDFNIKVDQMESYDGRIYIKQEGNILELLFREINNQILPTVHPVASVMPKATTLHQGCAIQNLLGDIYVNCFPASKTSYQIKIPQLNGVKIVDAKFDKGVLIAVVYQKGQYHTYVFRFDKDYNSYDLRVIKDHVYSGINMVTLDSGVCIRVDESSDLELFSKNMGSQAQKIIKDRFIDSNTSFYSSGGQILYTKDSVLGSVTMK